MQRINLNQLEFNPFTVIGEENFLLTAGVDSDWNTMTAGWGALGYVWNAPAVFVFVREQRYTLSFMERADIFSLSFFPPEKKDILDFCGTVSGRDTDKAKGAGLTPFQVDGAIAFEEANLIMTCQKLSETVIDGKTMIDESVKRLYPQEDWHRMFIGRILGTYIN